MTTPVRGRRPGGLHLMRSSVLLTSGPLDTDGGLPTDTAVWLRG
ncbi:hypothetical protein ABZ092_04845 [Streptomyces bobili]